MAESTGARTRITHVLTLAEKPGQVVWGGAERHLRLLLPALAQRGEDVEALVLATSPGPVIEEGLAEWRAAGVIVRVLARRSRGGRLRNLPGFVAQHLRLVHELRHRRGHLIHLHLDFFFMVVAARLARCRCVVLTLHNDPPLPRRAWTRRLLAGWLRSVASRCAAFIAISQRVAEHFRHASGCAPQRIEVVEYGLELPPLRPRTREERGWPQNRFLVGFVGRLVPQKNLFVLLEALARCPQLEAVLVGSGPLRPAIERFIAAHRLQNVRLEGAVENASELIPLFDVLCLPSRWEGLGLVLVEAMLQRVPIVGSRGGAIPDILGDGRYGILFETDDAVDLARALCQAEARPAERERRAEEAFHYARARFSVAAMAERTAAFYRRIAPEGPGGVDTQLSEERRAPGARVSHVPWGAPDRSPGRGRRSVVPPRCGRPLPVRARGGTRPPRPRVRVRWRV